MIILFIKGGMREMKVEGQSFIKNENIKHQSPIKSVFEKFGKQKDVELVYGEPIEYKNKCVLPVASARYFIGGGSGDGGAALENGEPASQEGYGEGGGGHISVKPLGVYEITEGHVKFKPTIDVKFLTLILAVLTFGLTFLLRDKFK